MAKKSKKTDLVLSEMDPLTPITNIDNLGSDKDPCFGKEYDLTTNECKLCGDSELCAICFAQKLNKTRAEIEKESHFKDMEKLLDIQGIKKYMRSLIRKELSRKDVISKAIDKFDITKKDARSIYKSLKKC